MIILNFIALLTVAKSYYRLLPLKTFLLQVSQYKPVFFKTPCWSIYIISYIIVLLIFVYQFLKFNEKKT